MVFFVFGESEKEGTPWPFGGDVSGSPNLGLPVVCVRRHKRKHATALIIQHIDTLPKYGKKTLNVRRST